MTLRVASPIETRVAQVLQDYLPAEIDLIDAEEGEFTTPDVPAANYHLWDRRIVPGFPAICTRLSRTRPAETRPEGFGARFSAYHELDVLVHVQLATAGEDALKLKKLIQRYTAGIYRVLCVEKEGLQTAADPTRFAHLVTLRGPIDYGPEVNQESGTAVRTGTVPVDVWRIESRT